MRRVCRKCRNHFDLDYRDGRLRESCCQPEGTWMVDASRANQRRRSGLILARRFWRRI